MYGTYVAFESLSSLDRRIIITIIANNIIVCAFVVQWLVSFVVPLNFLLPSLTEMQLFLQIFCRTQTQTHKYVRARTQLAMFYVHFVSFCITAATTYYEMNCLNLIFLLLLLMPPHRALLYTTLAFCCHPHQIVLHKIE